MRGGAPILSVCRADFIPGRYIRFLRSTGSYRSPYIRFIKKTCYGFFSKIPERVIINRLNGAETLMALGAADRIIAVNMQNTDWGKPYDDRYMEQGKALEKITYRNLTKEEAVLLNPDCIIGWYSTFTDKRLGTTDFWNARQVATYIQATSNMVKPGAGVEDECRFITDMGLIFHAESQAKLLTDEIWKEIEDVQEKPDTAITRRSWW